MISSAIRENSFYKGNSEQERVAFYKKLRNNRIITISRYHAMNGREFMYMDNLGNLSLHVGGGAEEVMSRYPNMKYIKVTKYNFPETFEDLKVMFGSSDLSIRDAKAFKNKLPTDLFNEIEEEVEVDVKPFKAKSSIVELEKVAKNKKDQPEKDANPYDLQGFGEVATKLVNETSDFIKNSAISPEIDKNKVV